LLKIKNKIAGRKASINLLNFSLISALVLIVFLIAIKFIEFGSESGGSIYVYYNNFTIKPIVIFLFIFPYLVFFTYLSIKYIGKNEIQVLILWLIIGFIIQLIIRYDYLHSFEHLITSEEYTSFYTATYDHSVKELLSNYESIADTLPKHAKSNMLGKVLFFYLLRVFTSSPKIMGLLIMILSNIGGILIYFISKLLFNHKKIALYSLILYFFIPAKIFHFPVLNTVTPVFALLPLFLMIKYLETLKKLYLIFLGISFYVLFIFEPLPFYTGILFLSIVIYYLYMKRIQIRHLIYLIGYTVVVTIMTFFIFLWIFKYNALNNFIYVVNDAIKFNVLTERKYDIWVVQNLKDFFINVGFLQSIIFFVFLSNIFYGIIAKIKRYNCFKKVVQFIFKPAILLTLSVFLIIFILDLVCVDRGEVSRVWIFIMVFFPIIVAHYCVKRKNSLAFYIVLLGSVLQSVVTMSMVWF